MKAIMGQLPDEARQPHTPTREELLATYARVLRATQNGVHPAGPVRTDP